MTASFCMRSVHDNAGDTPLGTMGPKLAPFPRVRRNRQGWRRARPDRVGRCHDGLHISLWYRGGPTIPYWRDCLTPSELNQLRQYRSSVRRAAFVTGRLLAKRSVIEHQWVAPVDGGRDACTVYQSIEILSGSGKRSSNPVIRTLGIQKPWSLSISHTDSWTAIALCRTPGRLVGIDLVDLDEPTSVPFLWYSATERRMIESSVCTTQTRLILWSLKEALFKSGQTEIPFIPTDWSTELADGRLRAFYRKRPYHAHTLIVRIPNRVVMSVAVTAGGTSLPRRNLDRPETFFMTDRTSRASVQGR
jgi:hypothetical protein